MAVTFLKVVDFFFISIGLQIISAGIYKLFINPNISLPGVMEYGIAIAVMLVAVSWGAKSLKPGNTEA